MNYYSVAYELYDEKHFYDYRTDNVKNVPNFEMQFSNIADIRVRTYLCN